MKKSAITLPGYLLFPLCPKHRFWNQVFAELSDIAGTAALGILAAMNDGVAASKIYSLNEVMQIT